VLEVVERSKTSLRSFYQHFSTKDELLLALIDKIMSESTRKWGEDTTGLPPAEALRVLIDRICTPAETTTQDKVNRGLTYYNDHLAESLPASTPACSPPCTSSSRTSSTVASPMVRSARASTSTPPPP
jgi:AcrR family transcriptional regulator